MTHHENRLYCSVACLAGALLVLVALTSGTAWAAPPVSEEAGQQKNMPPASLEDELFQGLDRLPAAERKRPRESAQNQGPEVDRDRQRRLTQGEDLGQQSERNSWLRIGTSMKNVQGRLAVGDLGRETQQLQKMISQDLSGLMEQFRQQSSGSSFQRSIVTCETRYRQLAARGPGKCGTGRSWRSYCDDRRVVGLSSRPGSGPVAWGWRGSVLTKI